MGGLLRNYALPGAAARRGRAREMREAVAEQLRREAYAEELKEQMNAHREAGTRAIDSSVYGATRRALRGALWRGRAPLRPVWALAALTAAGWAVWGSQPRAVAVAALWAVVAVVWWRRLAPRLDRPVERRYALACLAGAGAWLVSCAVWSPAGRGWMLLWPWTVAAILWWGPGRHWPSDYTPPAPVEEPEVEDSLRLRWETNIAGQGGKFPDSKIVDVTFDEHGATILLVKVKPGRDTVEDVTVAADRVSSGLETPQEQLIIERAPETVNPKRNPTLVQVKVLPKSPIKNIEWFLEPRYSEGKVLLGKFLDGIGEGSWRIYERNRMWGGSIWAGTGFGKSRLLETLAVTVRSPGWQERWPTSIVYIDGQDGTSSPLLQRNSTLTAGVRDVDEMLDALIRAGEARQRYNRYHGLTAFVPRPEMPGILVIADEQHGVVLKRNVARWERLAREFGKLGISVVGADQITDLSAYGDSEVLRSSMLAGNGGAMHIASRTAGALVPDLPVNPYKLPAIPGYFVKISAANSKERSAPLQIRYMPDRQAVDEGQELPVGVRVAEDWFPLGSEAPLDEMTARAMGDVYLKRTERAAARDEMLAAMIEGRELPDAEPASSAGPTDDVLAAAVARVPVLARLPLEEAIAAARELLGMPALDGSLSPSAELGARVLAVLGPPPSAEETASTRDVIRALLREKRRVPRKAIIAHVQTEIGTTESAVKQALQLLVRDEELDREPGREGLYVWLDKVA